MALLKESKVTKPDLIEATLIIVMAIWVITVLWLINLGFRQGTIELLAIESMSMFFLAFISIVIVVIAVFLADIRHELKHMY